MIFRSILFLALAAIVVASPAHDEAFLPKSMRMAREWQLRSLRRARERLRGLLDDLENLETASTCKANRRAKLSELLDQLRSARSCRYRGVGQAEYNRLRAICRNRSEIRDEIAVFVKRCSRRSGDKKANCTDRKVAPLRAQLKESFQACRTIGWKGEGRVERDGCPSINALKEEFDAVEAIRCGRVPDRTELLKDIERTKARIAYLLGLIRPSASSEPRPVRD